MKDRLIAIVGPTAVGKTALSFYLADHFHTDLISGDAYQIYRHMDIGTAKPSADELARYHHYLIDVADPGDAYSAGKFYAMAAPIIHEMNGKGRLPILVGGTGLYVQSLLEGYDFSAPAMTAAERDAAVDKIATSTEDELKLYIMEGTDWEPADWHELFSNTHRLNRLVAAIESGRGREFVRAGKVGLAYDAYVIGLSLPRPVLYERIEKRIDIMLEQGWLDEVRSLLDRGVDPHCQAMKAIGYEELAEVIHGELAMPEASKRIKTRTRRFAKRQLTWFKRMPYIHWYEKENYKDEAALAAQVINDLN